MATPFPRSLFAVAFGAAGLLLAASAWADIAVRDDHGAAVTLRQPARRIVSLAAHITELLFAAGGGDRIVGAVEFSDYPPEAARIPRVGDSRALDLERIVGLRPDLIVAWGHGTPQRQLESLRRLGVPLFYSEPRVLDDIPGTLERFGALLGTAATARDAAQRYRERLGRLRDRFSRRPAVTLFYQVWHSPLVTINGEHIISDAIRTCGGANVFAGLAPLAPTVSVESVVVANPEAIVASGVGSDDRAVLAQWRQWPKLAAVARGNLFAIDSDIVNRMTPRLLEGAEILCAALEAARARRPRAGSTAVPNAAHSATSSRPPP